MTEFYMNVFFAGLYDKLKMMTKKKNKKKQKQIKTRYKL